MEYFIAHEARKNKKKPLGASNVGADKMKKLVFIFNIEILEI